MSLYTKEEWIRDFQAYCEAGVDPATPDPEVWIEDYFSQRYPADSSREDRFGAAARYWREQHLAFRFEGVSVELGSGEYRILPPLMLALYDHYALCPIEQIHAEPKLGELQQKAKEYARSFGENG